MKSPQGTDQTVSLTESVEGVVDALPAAPTEIVHEVLAQLGTLSSGMIVVFSEQFGWAFYPDPGPANETPDQLCTTAKRWAAERYGEPQSLYPAKLYPKAMIDDYRQWKSNDRFGGLGITGRTLSSVEGSCFTDLSARIDREVGRIGFLGNGFSPIPLLAVERFSTGKTSTQPCIYDCLNYTAVHQDLQTLATVLIDRGYHPSGSLMNYLESVNELLVAERRCQLQIFRHHFGEDLNPMHQNSFALLINIYGPAGSSLKEQLELLAPGGELYKYGDIGPGTIAKLPAEYEVRKDEKGGWIIRRHSTL